jgi:uncharacterized membrane protein YjgN (DUF898 family)
MICNQVLSARLGAASTPGLSVAYLFLSLALTGVNLAISATATCVLYPIVYQRLFINDKAFSFTAKPNELFGLYIRGLLLTIVTLGFYMPWFIDRVISYFSEKTVYDGAAFTFQGKPKKLFKYYFLGAVLPALLLFAAFTLALVLSRSIGTTLPLDPKTMIMSFIAILVACLLFIPFICLLLSWSINYRWKAYRITLDADFWPACLYIVEQTFLVFITLGIWLPACFVNLYRYFIGKVQITDTMAEGSGNRSLVRFVGKTAPGFLLIWGQLLLCLITLGIYLPWGTAKIAKFFIENTELEVAESLPTTPAY